MFFETLWCESLIVSRWHIHCRYLETVSSLCLILHAGLYSTVRRNEYGHNILAGSPASVSTTPQIFGLCWISQIVLRPILRAITLQVQESCLQTFFPFGSSFWLTMRSCIFQISQACLSLHLEAKCSRRILRTTNGLPGPNGAQGSHNPLISDL